MAKVEKSMETMPEGSGFVVSEASEADLLVKGRGRQGHGPLYAAIEGLGVNQMLTIPADVKTASVNNTTASVRRAHPDRSFVVRSAGRKVIRVS